MQKSHIDKVEFTCTDEVLSTYEHELILASENLRFLEVKLCSVKCRDFFFLPYQEQSKFKLSHKTAPLRLCELDCTG